MGIFIYRFFLANLCFFSKRKILNKKYNKINTRIREQNKHLSNPLFHTFQIKLLLTLTNSVFESLLLLVKNDKKEKDSLLAVLPESLKS